jgi:hypothetical protein
LATVFSVITGLARLCYAVFRITMELLEPEDKTSELKFGWLFKIAGIAGILGLIAIQVHWNWGGQGFTDVADEYIWGSAGLDVLVLTPIYAGGALILATLILFVSTTENRYRENAVHLVVPLAKLACSAGVIGAFWGVVKLSSYGMDQFARPEVEEWFDTRPVLVQGGLLVVMVPVIMALAVALVALVFAFFAFLAGLAVSSSRDLFGAKDGHPYLRALASIILASWSITLAIWGLTQHGVNPDYPLVVSALLLACGPVFSTATSLFEIRCLNKAGLSIREPKRSAGYA